MPHWMRRHRVVTAEPGVEETFCVTLVEGRRTAIQPIMEYEAALATAHELLRTSPCHIMVLPMTADTMINLFGMEPETGVMSPTDAEDRKLVIDTCRTIVRDSHDPDARTDAFDVLTKMGVW